MKPRDAERSKNFFALGLISLDVHAPGRPDHRVDRREVRVTHRRCATPNLAAFKAGLPLRRDRRAVRPPYEVAPRQLAPGRYRNITGNVALPYGLIAGSADGEAADPRTRRTRSRPASDILHELSKHKNFGVRTLQAEDEIAAAAVAVGAAFAGQLGVTATSGPGVDLKSEALGLGDQPRAAARRRSTCSAAVRRPVCPTKTEQSDLMLAMYGPSRRGAAADRRGAVAERTASTPRSRRCASR
mgnify:CR=1 FL=1